MLEEGLIARLYADETVVACLADATSIYPVVLPQDAELPALTFRRISGVEDPLLNASAPPVRARIQFEAWSNDYLESLLLKRAVLGSLLDFYGPLPDTEATTVRDITHDTDSDDFGDANRCFCAKFDLFVMYLE